MRGSKSGRPLSHGEIALAGGLFGDAIDYRQVRLHHRKWWPLQPRDWIMAPAGELWLHPDGPLAGIDFAEAGLVLQGLFIHEMTHVWQHQQGIRLLLRRHPFCRYDYRLEPGKRFEDYGIEQQAEIVRDAFLASRGAPRAADRAPCRLRPVAALHAAARGGLAASQAARLASIAATALSK
jgi:hypothetical protein